MLGADTKDHVPPKSLFATEKQRLTLPAHKKCNNEFAEDEEYFRDINVNQAAALKMKNVDTIIEKIARSWEDKGRNRFKKIMTTAEPVNVKLSSGEITKYIKIKPDPEKLKKIAIKIARGVIYNDTGVITHQSNYSSFYLPITEVTKVRSRDKEELFWKAMGQESCLHSIYGPHFGARRIYLLSEKQNGVYTVTCMMSLILGSAFYVVIMHFLQDEIKNKELEIFIPSS
ncbi:MAG: hypothetical protein HOP10_12995 [Chitinophagaceae bacterium]|nr:hypothetical protein [Chitinophagaceae bacterium]